MSLSKEQQLYNAASDGELEKVESLCSDPNLNIDWQDQRGFTPLSGACQKGHLGVVEYLLSLKGIDPNKPANDGATPFFMSCQEGHKEVVSLLLADPRIGPNKPMNTQGTPLWFASQNGHLQVVQRLFASERNIDTKIRSTTYNNTTAAQQARAIGVRTTKEDQETEEVFQRRKTYSPSAPT